MKVNGVAGKTYKIERNPDLANLNGWVDSGVSVTLTGATATQDSLFGNTETFGGLANLTPRFALQNLLPEALYNLDFYASRHGVTDTRETRYTVTGATEAFVDLNAANNVDAVASLPGILPSTSRELLISLNPGPNNDNPNHFTYLGVMRLSWSSTAAPPEIKITPSARAPGAFNFRIHGAKGMIYTVLASSDLKTWREAARVELVEDFADLQIPMTDGAKFVRILQ